jgi:hypothetical protein
MRLAAADPRLLEQRAYIVMTSEGTPFPPAFTEFLGAQRIPRVFKPIARRDLLTLLGQAEARLG